MGDYLEYYKHLISPKINNICNENGDSILEINSTNLTSNKEIKIKNSGGNSITISYDEAASSSRKYIFPGSLPELNQVLIGSTTEENEIDLTWNNQNPRYVEYDYTTVDYIPTIEISSTVGI